MNKVEAYLAALPTDQRVALENMRRIIRAAAPDAVEDLGYGMPRFKYRAKPLIAFAAWKKHLSLYAGYDPINRHRAELADFEIEQATIRLQPDRLLSDALLRTIVLERVADIDAELARPGKGR